LSPSDRGFKGPEPEGFHRKVAAAIEGDREALAAILEREDLEEWVRDHRMGAALFVAAEQLGVEGPAVDYCQSVCMATAGRWMRLRALLSRSGSVLDEAGIPWIPLKGLDTAERFFPRPELRLSSDLDVLVPFDRLDDAMAALERVGWSFETSELIDAYQRAEGYNWGGRGLRGDSFELHYRLWGMVPQSLVEACWKTAVEAPELGSKGLKLAPPMAFVVSAVHSWVHAGSPQFIYWWEMKLIADRLENADEVVAAAREHELQFPVGLAAEYVGRLWDHELLLEIARELLEDIPLPERLALGRVRRRGIDAMTLELLYVARLFAGRPSRMGWKSIWRRLWPHAGIVEDTTSGALPWWRRRVVAAARNLGMK
jgi:hypothetical protein